MNQQNDFDQGRLLTAVALCAVILIAWSYLFPPPPAVERPAPDAGAATEGAAPEQPAADPAAQADPSAPAVVQFERRSVATLRAEGSSRIELGNDGALRSWILEESQYGVRDAEGKESPFPIVGTLDDPSLKGIFLPPRLEIGLDGEDSAGEYTLSESDSKFAVLQRTDARTGLEITRRFELLPETYQLRETVTLKNPSATAVPYQLTAVVRGAQNDDEAGGSMFIPPVYAFEAVCQRGDEFERVPVAEVLENLTDPEEPTRFTDAVRWGGVDNRYFMTAVSADEGSIAACELNAGPDAVGLKGAEVPPRFSFVSNRLELMPGEVGANGEVTQSVVWYSGPKKLNVLQAVEPGMSEAIDFGFFAVICLPMLYLMRTFFEFAGNWGIAIILLTLLVKLLTFPLTHKQYKSMAGMKKLQPQLKALQEKYKEDRMKLQQEMMQLYKKHKVNPLAGCLPALMMMPIYFALYRTIYSAVELYQADFALWIHDLSQRDPYFITPLLLGVLMFAQFKLNPSAGTDATQQKIMMYAMPIMFTGMMLFLPSGLVLYIMVNTILGIAQQFYLLKKAEEEPAPARA